MCDKLFCHVKLLNICSKLCCSTFEQVLKSWIQGRFSDLGSGTKNAIFFNIRCIGGWGQKSPIDPHTNFQNCEFALHIQVFWDPSFLLQKCSPPVQFCKKLIPKLNSKSAHIIPKMSLLTSTLWNYKTRSITKHVSRCITFIFHYSK